jgi:hypothetical protein
MIDRVKRLAAVSGACASALALAGCQIYHVPNTNQFYTALGYTPKGDPAMSANATDCDRGLDVEKVAKLDSPQGPTFPPRTGARQFRVMPGMTLRVRQATGRLSGASEAPIVSEWSWRIPNSVSGGCTSGSRWTASDITTVRALVHGAQLSDGSAPKPFDLWIASVRCAQESRLPQGVCAPMPPRAPTAAGAQERLAVNLLDPFVRQMLLEHRWGETAPSLEGDSGASKTVAAECLPRASDFAGTDFSWQDVTDCLDPAKPNAGAPVCSRAHKRLLTAANGETPLTETSLVLLTTSDALGLVAPRALISMAHPGFDLKDGSPGSGGGPPRGFAGDAQSPLAAARAYQGFMDFEVLVPVRIAGHKQPVLVSVCATAASVAAQFGGRVQSVGRLAAWMPKSIQVKTPKPDEKLNLGQATRQDGRVYLNFAEAAHAAKALWLDPGAEEDLLVAPGDLIILAK